MHREIQALINAYLLELSNEAVTVTAIAKYINAASAERQKLLKELAGYFRSNEFRDAALLEPQPSNFEEQTQRMLRELERSFEKTRHAAAPITVSRHVS